VLGNDTGSLLWWDGNIEQFQFTKANKFGIVPTAASLLIQFDGSDADQSDYTAETGQTVSMGTTLSGEAQLDTGASKFGGSSLLLDGVDDFATVPDSTDWAFGTGDFTIDGWIKLADGNENYMIAQIVDGSHYWRFGHSGAPDTITFGMENGGANLGVFSAALTQDTDWHHIAVTRQGTTFRIFVDGVLGSTDTGITETMPDFASPLQIGTFNTGTQQFFNGNIDSIRIVTGHALWTATFTVPDAAHPLFGTYDPADTSFVGLVVPTAVLTQDTITEPTEEYAEVGVGRSQAIVIA
jgi:hypothetical protein